MLARWNVDALISDAVIGKGRLIFRLSGPVSDSWIITPLILSGS